jgi:hypothetical protein
MSFCKTLRIAVIAGAVASTTALLTGCSFSPVYSGALASQPSLQLAYAKPNSRLEQVVYQELSLRLGSSPSATAPLASVTVSPGEADLVLSRTDNPNKPREVTVSATLTITPRDGSATSVQTYTRRATSNYTRSGQVLADNSASIDAFERAAKSAAESLRLAVLAGVSR